MVTEDYCSFEVAKLLKEKGFNEPTETIIYPDNNIVFVDTNSISRIPHQKLRNSENNIYDNSVCCPTLQMVFKWLREIHNLHIDIFIGITEDDTYTFWTYFIVDLKGNMIVNAYGEDINFKGESYEQTVDSAIKYSLTNLIK